MKKSLLLVVDVQKGFMNDETNRVVPKINQLVCTWQQKGWPIAYSRFINSPGSNWERLRDWHELKTEPQTELAEELVVASEFVFKKTTYSSWSNEIMALCQSHKVRDVVLAGVDTNECVLATALGIFDAGYIPWVVDDACATSGGKDVHDQAISFLKALLGYQQVKSCKAIR